jgi:hypothetical protein
MLWWPENIHVVVKSKVDTFHSYMQYRFWHRTWWPKWHGPASFFLKSTTYLTINGSCWFWWTCRLWLFKLSFHNIHWHQSNFASLMLIGHKTFHNNVNKAGNSVMKRKFKQWLSTILSISKNEQPSHTSNNWKQNDHAIRHWNSRFWLGTESKMYLFIIIWL